jgi:transposase/cyclophilin family peptidyl-prolyl cis-trans isomerase
MGYKVGVDKNQISFLPVCLDDFVGENHICRVISAFTELLDMEKLGYKYSVCQKTGCPPYSPKMMLNLYIYGYLHGVNSSRKLRDEAQRNIEVMWLMDRLQPDDKTICNFRKDNIDALRKTFREFSLICRKLGLYGSKLIAIDGTKVRANNSRKNNHNRVTVEREIARLEKRIDEYIDKLDENDKAQKDEKLPNEADIKKALEKLKSRKKKFKNLLSRIEQEKEVSTVDPDSRLMHQNGDGRTLDVCYNVQTAVDSENGMIVDFLVNNRADDRGNLFSVSEQAKEILAVENLTVLADKGYYDGQDIAKCEAKGTTCLVAKPKSGGRKAEEKFLKKEFKYDKNSDTYTCPEKNTFKFMRTQKHNDGKEYKFYANFSACSKCELREKCTKSKYRKLLRLPYQDVLDEVDRRTQKNLQLYKKRQEIVEHPFGTIKSTWGFRQFLCRTTPKVSAEMALAYLAYNLRRMVNIFQGNSNKILAKLGA